MPEKILIVEDDAEQNELMSRILAYDGYKIHSVETGVRAIKLAEKEPFDLIISDLRLPGIDGIEVLEKISSENPNIMGIIVTGYGDMESAVKALRLGVCDYIKKPFEVDELRHAVKKALELKALRKENLYMKSQLKRKYAFENIIGEHPKMIEVLKLVEKVADTLSTILITGESGTGKEIVARAIHYNSSRRERCLIPVNCAAIPETLLESELFGHVKGAFTGAITNRIGRFEAANGGTIFLDEIAEMSPNLQVKLLRVLQESAFEPVGSTRQVKVDVRVITATNKNLEELVAQGKFRDDLYYRLNVIPIHIPPLRERRSDIPLLIAHFLAQFTQVHESDRPKKFSKEAMEYLMNYDWPGNVRELENLVERLMILTDGDEITVDDLPDRIKESSGHIHVNSSELSLPEGGMDLNGFTDYIETKMIYEALRRTKGNKNKAAKMLNLKRTTLVEKIKKKKIDGCSRTLAQPGAAVPHRSSPSTGDRPHLPLPLDGGGGVGVTSASPSPVSP